MLAGTLAITGVGLVDVFGFAGFYSKDSILEAAYASTREMGAFAFWCGIIAALLTSFYSWRLVFLTFYGKPRWAASEHIRHAVHHGHGEHDEANPPAQESSEQQQPHHVPDPHHGEGTGGYHPHESPASMLIPLGVLSLGAAFAGFLFSHAFISAGDGEFWKGSIAFGEHLIHAMHEVPVAVKWMPFIVMALGFLAAWYGYIRNPEFPAVVTGQIGVIYRFVYNKWYFDELYRFVFMRPAFWLGRLFWRGGDVGIIDRFGPNGAAWTVLQGTRLAQKVQSGYLYSYALIMLLGLIGAVSWVMVG
jgi:NADH-quinone oxidoreductase subunit L